MKRADDAMKVLRKQIAQARREGKIPPRAGNDGQSKEGGTIDTTLFSQKNEDKEMSDSELEEIEEQLTG